jgi:hypothetical protein
MIHPYHESVLSQLYPGNQHSSNCLMPAVSTFENMLSLSAGRRAKIVWRLDQGFGGDANINWLLERNYGVVAKGHSNRRSADLVRQVKRWRAVRSDKFVGCVPTPDGFARPVNTFSIRYATTHDWKHAYLLSTLNLSATATVHFYDQRGGAETEFRSDKSGGLQLHKRRKHRRAMVIVSAKHRILASSICRFRRRTGRASADFPRMKKQLAETMTKPIFETIAYRNTG